MSKCKYEDQIVGECSADIVVDNKVLIETKPTKNHRPTFGTQLLNYLKASSFEVGLIINFGKSVEIKCLVC